jgi:vacuolar-type H+-ATPase subunit I/STV1
MTKPTREEAKKQLKALDKMQDWLEQNLDYVIEISENEEDDYQESIPIEFDKEKIPESFEQIRSALRFCL